MELIEKRMMLKIIEEKNCNFNQMKKAEEKIRKK